MLPSRPSEDLSVYTRSPPNTERPQSRCLEAPEHGW